MNEVVYGVGMVRKNPRKGIMLRLVEGSARSGRASGTLQTFRCGELLCSAFQPSGANLLNKNQKHKKKNFNKSFIVDDVAERCRYLQHSSLLDMIFWK